MDYKVTDTELTSIANAIRTKGGTSGQLTFPSDFVTAIGSIPSGGGDKNIGAGFTFTPYLLFSQENLNGSSWIDSIRGESVYVDAGTFTVENNKLISDSQTCYHINIPETSVLVQIKCSIDSDSQDSSSSNWYGCIGILGQNVLDSGNDWGVYYIKNENKFKIGFGCEGSSRHDGTIEISPDEDHVISIFSDPFSGGKYLFIDGNVSKNTTTNTTSGTGMTACGIMHIWYGNGGFTKGKVSEIGVWTVSNMEFDLPDL